MSFEQTIADIVRREIAASIDRLAAKVADEVAARAAASAETLQPLHIVLGISPRAANARLCRDLELRKLGHRLGRRTLFKRADVDLLLAERQRERSGVRSDQ